MLACPSGFRKVDTAEVCNACPTGCNSCMVDAVVYANWTTTVNSVVTLYEVCTTCSDLYVISGLDCVLKTVDPEVCAVRADN
jgi:hypothetical protein